MNTTFIIYTVIVKRGFDTRAGQIERSVANGSPPLRRFCVVQALSRGDGSATRYTLPRNIASVMDDLIPTCAVGEEMQE